MQPFELTIVYEKVEAGRIQAIVPAVPGVISVGETTREARENAIDALCEVLATPPERIGADARAERLHVRLDVRERDLGRGL